MLYWNELLSLQAVKIAMLQWEYRQMAQGRLCDLLSVLEIHMHYCLGGVTWLYGSGSEFIFSPMPSWNWIVTVTSKWTSWRPKSPASRLFTQTFVQAQIKENIKAPRYWPLWGNSSVTSEFPTHKASNAENVYISWRHHEAGNLWIVLRYSWTRTATWWCNDIDRLWTFSFFMWKM